jgi:proteasome regulatory subunit
MNLADNVDLSTLADDTDGFSGAELASLATEAGMFAIREERTEIRTADFESALEKVKEEDDSAGTPIAFA